MESKTVDDSPIRDPLSRRWEGLVFTNPVSGERIEVLEIGEDEEGPFVKGHLTVAAGGTGPPRHVHPHHEEWFTVESGELTVHRGEETRALVEGETVIIPPGTAHGFENRTASPVTFIGGMRPHSRLTHVLSTLFGLARDGKLRSDGSPRFLQAMVFARAMKDVMYLASPPYRVQQALWTLFAPVGRLMGYRPVYDRYLRPSFWEPADPGDSEREGPEGPGRDRLLV